MRGDQKAVAEVLDRLEGKATQHVVQETKTPNPLDDMADEDILELIAAVRSVRSQPSSDG